MNSIAVLLTVHNRKEKTIECLKRLFDQEIPKDFNISVFLTDDGCTDGTREEVQRNFPSVNIVNGDGNLYWNRGMWAAWEAASKSEHDYYLWINDDTFLYEGAILNLINTSAQKENMAIIVGACQSLDHRYMTYGGQTKERKLVVPDGCVKDVFVFNGNIVLIPNYVFKKVGNLDYYYLHDMGDIDYGLRAGKEGVLIFQCSVYLGECDRHEKLSNWCNPNIPFRKRWKGLHSPLGQPPQIRFYYAKKHEGIISALIHYLLLYIRCLFPWIWTSLEKDVFVKK